MSQSGLIKKRNFFSHSTMAVLFLGMFFLVGLPQAFADDQDWDGIDDAVDNCLGVGNPLQKDHDGDAFGNLCEPGPGNIDTDGDGIDDAVDNCVNDPNPEQKDWPDGDGIGNVCEPGDGQPDTDGDLVGDGEGGEDNCPNDPNPLQRDLDKDGVGTVCDDDEDVYSNYGRVLSFENSAMKTLARMSGYEATKYDAYLRAIDFETRAFESIIRQRNDGGPVTSCGCHSGTVFGNRRVVLGDGDFSEPIHHVVGNPDAMDCLACHYTGDHKSGIVKLIDPDYATDIIYQYDPADPRALEPFCAACHDDDGARSGFWQTPFSDGVPVLDHHAAHNDVEGMVCGTCHGMHGSLFDKTCTDCHSGVSTFNAHVPTHGGGTETTCQDCHADIETVHQATPGSDWVVVFSEGGHDSEMEGDGAAYIDCTSCHINQLTTVHANNCINCHPLPYRTLESWDGGCQQGGCHTVKHEDATQSHWTVEEDCLQCHDGPTWNVPVSNCANCHAAANPRDTTAPVTTSNAQSSYILPAQVDFSIIDGGKVGIGTTFSRFGEGELQTGSSIIISPPGTYTLEFWSVDQAGNVELQHNFVDINLIPDTAPPVTTSNAKSTYERPANITLTATDNSALGVKTTYYSINNGPVQSGNTVYVPELPGTYDYTLEFWSDDWSGNREAVKAVEYQVVGGSGTFRLVWGDSDNTGSPCPDDPEAWAEWTIKQGAKIIATGSGECPDWSGVDGVVVPASLTPYHISIDWWHSYYGFDDNTTFPSEEMSNGDLVRLSY